MGISINEICDEVALLKILTVFEEVTLQKNITGKVKIENHRYPVSQKRISPFLSMIFNSYHSETGLMRYIKNWREKIWH